VDDELTQLSTAFIGEASVPQDELGEVLELQDREISSKRGLLALFANDSQANISFLDHRNVVTAIANTSDTATLSNLLYFSSDNCFLLGSATADTHRLSLVGCLEKFIHELLLGTDSSESASINNHHLTIFELLYPTADVKFFCLVVISHPNHFKDILFL